MTTSRADEGRCSPHGAAAQSSGITVCRNLRAAGMTEIMDQILHAGGIVRLEALVS